MLSMMDVKTVMIQLTSILEEISLPRDPNHYKTGFWGRAQVYIFISIQSIFYLYVFSLI